MRKQCSKCPWRVDVDPYDIPDGYCETKHRNLKKTIAEEGLLPSSLADRSVLRVMACHESSVGKEKPCVGWLHNQLGPGNNIALRFQALHDKSLFKYELVGEQHETFEDTLPRPTKKRKSRT